MRTFQGHGSNFMDSSIVPDSKAASKIGTDGESNYPFLTEKEIADRIIAWIDHLKVHAGTMKLGTITEEEESDLLKMLLDL